MSPVMAILLHSPGRKPWVNCFHSFIEPHRGFSNECKAMNSKATNQMLAVSAAPTELLIFVCSIYPGFHIGLYPHSTLGYEECRPKGLFCDNSRSNVSMRLLHGLEYIVFRCVRCI